MIEFCYYCEKEFELNDVPVNVTENLFKTTCQTCYEKAEKYEQKWRRD